MYGCRRFSGGRRQRTRYRGSSSSWRGRWWLWCGNRLRSASSRRRWRWREWNGGRHRCWRRRGAVGNLLSHIFSLLSISDQVIADVSPSCLEVYEGAKILVGEEDHKSSRPQRLVSAVVKSGKGHVTSIVSACEKNDLPADVFVRIQFVSSLKKPGHDSGFASWRRRCGQVIYDLMAIVGEIKERMRGVAGTAPWTVLPAEESDGNKLSLLGPDAGDGAGCLPGGLHFGGIALELVAHALRSVHDDFDVVRGRGRCGGRRRWNNRRGSEGRRRRKGWNWSDVRERRGWCWRRSECPKVQTDANAAYKASRERNLLQGSERRGELGEMVEEGRERARQLAQLPVCGFLLQFLRHCVWPHLDCAARRVWHGALHLSWL